MFGSIILATILTTSSAITEMADMCNRIWEPQSLALTPFIVEMVELRKTNENNAYEKVLSELNCTHLED